MERAETYNIFSWSFSPGSNEKPTTHVTVSRWEQLIRSFSGEESAFDQWTPRKDETSSAIAELQGGKQWVWHDESESSKVLGRWKLDCSVRTSTLIGFMDRWAATDDEIQRRERSISYESRVSLERPKILAWSQRYKVLLLQDRFQHFLVTHTIKCRQTFKACAWLLF